MPSLKFEFYDQKNFLNTNNYFDYEVPAIMSLLDKLIMNLSLIKICNALSIGFNWF